MKKIITFVLIAVFAVMLVTSVSAAEFKNAGELYWSWVDKYYPEYVTGVWSSDGGEENLTIGVLDNEIGEAGKAEMLELIENDSSITFVYQEYPRLLLMEIMDELNSYIEKGLAFAHGGLYDYENRVKITLDISKKNDPTSESVKAEMIEKYGDAIIFDYGELGVVEELKLQYVGNTVTLTEAEPENGSGKLMLFTFISVAVLLTFILILAVKRKKALSLQTTDGRNMTAKQLSYKDIEKLIEESDPEIPKELDAKILSNIQKF